MRNLICFTLILLALLSCSPLHKPRPVSIPLSPEAKKIYTFLRFLDLENQKKIEEAKLEAQQLLQLNPEPYIYLEVANFYWRNLDFNQARNILKQGLKKFPENKNLYLSLAKSYLAEKRLKDAATTLEEYLAIKPEDFSVYQELAAIYLENKEYSKTIDLLKKLPPEKQNKITYYYLARANFELGLTQKAEALLQKTLKLDPEFFEAWAELAYIYEMNKKYAEAEEIYTKLLEQEENNEDLVLRIIELNLKLNNPKKAKTFLEDKDIDFKLKVFLKFLENKYYEYAENILEDVKKEEKGTDRVNFYSALLYYEKYQDYNKALQYLNKITPKSSFYLQSLEFKIQILLLQKNYALAQKTLDEVKQAYPNHKEFYILQIYAFEQQKKYTQALSWIEQALQKWPKDKEILYRKAIILENQNQRQKSLELMEKIISLYPDYDPALNFVGYVLAEEGKDLNRAKLLIETALKMSPNNGYYLDSLAWVYFKLKELDKAWEYIQKAVSFTADDPTIWQHYGDIARSLNLKKEAIRGYKQSLKLNPHNLELKKLLQKLSEN
ncbi:MAG TPA: hypothetical protein DIT19_00930 [Desulfonauticus sp.]|jgi:tetratricopeptide (TPR) repeat protein|nr:MAG: Tetratricopeptide TPR_2 repeat protein [Desulfonauticus sp. 38_4375]MDK2920617.1 hypothetical protein [Desulfonauticus sp.]HCO11775.1 hypothetical protein [Desulfonauticus sp.]